MGMINGRGVPDQGQVRSWGGSLRVLASRRRLGVMLQHASVRPHVLVLLGYTLLFAGWAIRRLQTKG